MSNYECTCYARIAVQNLAERNIEITVDTIFYEMTSLFDIYSEEKIKELAFERL